MKIIRDIFNYVHSTRCSVPAGMFYNVARVIKYEKRFFLRVSLWYEELKCLKIDLEKWVNTFDKWDLVELDA
ncbi:hypothetical protein WN51_07562 [Melipona quadrifasciata]|uniref:Uncharacterized protein n=1 Tax=Melipona quadrifasciata TaxID=166423 RepID=A0A0N0U747_9HYME|nr:hypothetical protein WN51_07562 [Melipona quadrifasciata]